VGEAPGSSIAELLYSEVCGRSLSSIPHGPVINVLTHRNEGLLETPRSGCVWLNVPEGEGEHLQLKRENTTLVCWACNTRQLSLWTSFFKTCLGGAQEELGKNDVIR
jgi:hypothetical protein